MNNDEIILHTQCWVKDVIVKYNICPFARKEVESGTIHYAVSKHTDKALLLSDLMVQCQKLDKHPEIETTLLIMPVGLEGFYDFLDLVELANDLLEMENYEGVYQLANFHPDYCFAGEVQSEPSNYTNRSPYPTLHIIREESMELAINNHPDVDAIPDRNIAFANKKGNPFFADLLARCFLKK
ncbi:DUF1415 domain-containing protein [Psychromonas sp. psych-6C06]|uniref:DUF1415 domain-containing protein n=1 Tax=Psychromonas sp. psych-6C06 TaxID=2058089 RepID=UPI000C334009|nr:DUF1415 domain-containing protein [Psychromonas sp. psych-6C06]PKF63793.1 DUF1415 domain-containing protein [Psychromonas sp. psych-6C06]